MSAQQSDLSNPKYGYDMVVATTQSAVNATMKEWLSKYKGQTFIQAYIYDPSANQGQGGPSPTDFEALKIRLGFDPFSLPANVPMEDPHITKLMEHRFMFAFKTEFGLPNFSLDKIPPVIEFNKEGSYVTYNMTCKDFQIIDLQPGLYEGPRWINLSQDAADEPWVFSFTIDLDLRSDNINNHYHNLPEKTQKEIKNLGIDMFSVQQLFLDLNAAGLANNVAIKGIDKSSTAYLFLVQVFINTYLAQISKEGGIMLGYSVVAKEAFPQNISLIPTDMTFMISSYKDQAGRSLPEYGAYTLNYLIMSADRPMHAPVPFSWNWVDNQQLSQYAGVMAVNKTAFVDFLRGLLSPGLSAIAKKPTTHFHINCLECQINWGYKEEEAPQRYSLVNNYDSHVLTYTYEENAASRDSQFCGIYGTWGNLDAKYSVQSDVYLEGTNIRIVTTSAMYIDLNIIGGTTKGYFARKTATTTYTIGVDSYGSISVINNGTDIKDHSESINPSWWSKFLTLGDIQRVVNKIHDSVSGWLESFLSQDAYRIGLMLNSSSGWTFPGARTYAFMNAQFSEKQDLVANVLYVSPKTKPEVLAQMLKAVKEDPQLLMEPADSLEKLLLPKIPQLATLIADLDDKSPFQPSEIL